MIGSDGLANRLFSDVHVERRPPRPELFQILHFREPVVETRTRVRTLPNYNLDYAHNQRSERWPRSADATRGLSKSVRFSLLHLPPESPFPPSPAPK